MCRVVNESRNRVRLKDVTFQGSGSCGLPIVPLSPDSSGMVDGPGAVLRHDGLSTPVAAESKDVVEAPP